MSRRGRCRAHPGWARDRTGCTGQLTATGHRTQWEGRGTGLRASQEKAPWWGVSAWPDGPVLRLRIWWPPKHVCFHWPAILTLKSLRRRKQKPVAGCVPCPPRDSLPQVLTVPPRSVWRSLVPTAFPGRQRLLCAPQRRRSFALSCGKPCFPLSRKMRR